MTLIPRKIADAFGDKLGNGVMSFSAFFGGFGCAFGLGVAVEVSVRCGDPSLHECGANFTMNVLMYFEFEPIFIAQFVLGILLHTITIIHGGCDMM